MDHTQITNIITGIDTKLSIIKCHENVYWLYYDHHYFARIDTGTKLLLFRNNGAATTFCNLSNPNLVQLIRTHIHQIDKDIARELLFTQPNISLIDDWILYDNTCRAKFIGWLGHDKINLRTGSVNYTDAAFREKTLEQLNTTIELIK